MKRALVCALGIAAQASAAPVRAARAAEPLDEIIDDGTPQSLAPRPSESTPGEPSAFYARGASRFTAFVDDADANADRYESRTFLFLGAKSSSQEANPWRVEVRTDLLARFKSHPEETNGQAWDLEARPWELWWRTRIASALTMTLGYQPLAWGVLDAGAAADPFASYDLRLGPVLTPAEVRIPLPAARLTWSPSSRIDWEFAYLPFFTPHRFDVGGTRYASLPSTALAPLAKAFDPGTLTRITAPLAQVNGVDARPDRGELGLRSTVHFAAFDLGVTAALARNRFPSYRVTEAFAAALATGSGAALLRVQQDLDAGVRPIEAVHAHYMQVAVDAQGSWGSMPWGAELGLSSKRELLSSAPLTAAAPPRANVLQGGARMSKSFGDLLVTAQAAVYTLLDPSSSDAVLAITPMLFGAARTVGLGLVTARYETGAFFLEASAIGLCAGPEASAHACAGTTVLASGRVAYGTDEWALSLGGTRLSTPANGSLPIGTAIDQVALRADFTPAAR